MSEDERRGRFCWYQLLTPDPAAAATFYNEVTGWTTTAREAGGELITMWMRGETAVGGMLQLPQEAVEEGAVAHWLPYIATPDAYRATSQAMDMGGSVLVPATEIEGLGRYAVLSDPQGALFATLAASGDIPGHDGPWLEGEVSWRELATTDHEAAFAFYSSLFGWEKTDSMDMGPGGLYQMYGRGGTTLGGMFNQGDDMPGPPYWLCYISVDDVHRVAPLIESLGGEIKVGPMEVPGGDWIAQCTDPQGAAFAIHSSSAAA